MKYLGLSVLIGSALLLQGASGAEQFNSTNTVGISCVESSLETFPIGVIYGDYAVSNTVALITNQLVATNLEAGDQLLVWNESLGEYTTYELTSKKTWEGIESIVGSEFVTPDPAEEFVKYGRGVWLLRNDVTNRTDRKIYLFGQVPMGVVTTVIAGNGGSGTRSTLIGFPVSEQLELNKEGLVDWTGVAKNDQIRLMLASGQSKIYRWDTKKSKWYSESYNDIGLMVKDYNCVLPRGQAFWYNRSTTDSVTFTWHLDKAGVN